MPDISLPDVHLPDLKLPDGLRDINRRDIQSAINDRMPKRIDMPDVDLSKVELPKAVEDRLKQVEKRLDSIDLSKVDVRKAVEARMPGRKRSNPILPLAAVLAVGSAIAAAWWLITSPTAADRVRIGADRMWRKVTGQATDVVRYDQEDDLGSLLPNPNQTRPAVEAETWPDSYSELGETVSAGNGASVSSTVASSTSSSGNPSTSEPS
jgi:hypothetical protein